MSKDKENKINFRVEDEEGNNITEKEDELVVDKELFEGEDDEDNLLIEDEKDSKNNDKKEEDENEEDEPKDKKGETSTQKKPTRNRAQERIMQVIKEKKELETKYQREMSEMRQQLQNTSKFSVENQKELLEGRIGDVKQSMARMQEEGKFTEAAELQSTLNELQIKKTVVDSELNKIEATKDFKQQKTQEEQEFDDTEVLAWVVRNRKWWESDKVKTTLAVKLSKKMEKEGFDPSSRDFYEELDERIREFIGEDNNGDDKMSSKEEISSAQKTSEERRNKSPQTASGASRSPSAVTKQGKQLVIRLTKEERQMANQMGISEMEWAKQKYRQLKMTDENGYQTVMDRD
jgi:hypothetical protein